MDKIVFVVCLLLFAVLTVFVLRIANETRKMDPRQHKEDEDLW